MKVHLAFLGCKLNQSEMESLQSQLAQAGCAMASAEEADVVVLNTCAVTAEAARKSRQVLRRLRAAAPHARLIAAGCYAELWPREVADAGRPDLVVGNRDKGQLASILGAFAADSQAPAPASQSWRRTRAFVKIQDGCDNACAYCVVHIARGASRSVALEDVVAQVRAAAETGRKEVVLTGVNIGTYGNDTGGPDLGALLRVLLDQTRIPRIRLSSLEPWSFRAEWLHLWDDLRLCRHLHLPLQSGSDAVLQRMGRPYRAGDFAVLAQAAQAAVPGMAITTDVIVGFPGETDADHETTLELAKAVGFARIHVFPFSPRPGTPAATMHLTVPDEVIQRRGRELRTLSARLAGQFAGRFVGQTMDVLWEQTKKGGKWTGLTGNYLRVYADSGAPLGNRITPTLLVEQLDNGLRGRIAQIDNNVLKAL